MKDTMELMKCELCDTPVCWGTPDEVDGWFTIHCFKCRTPKKALP